MMNLFLYLRFENATQHYEDVQKRLQQDTDPPEASEGDLTQNNIKFYCGLLLNIKSHCIRNRESNASSLFKIAILYGNKNNFRDFICKVL